MSFLVLLLTVAAYKLLGWHLQPQHDQWFYKFTDRLSSVLKGSPQLVMLVALLSPLAVAGFVLSLAEHWLFGFVGLLLHVLILFYALGRGNLFEQLNAYLFHWRSGDYQSAYHHARQHFSDELEGAASDIDSLHLSCCRGLLYQWFEQVFVIVFWYLLAGPLAALFMRLLSLYEQRNRKQGYVRSQLLHVLEWLPVRLLTLVYAVAGNFLHCFKLLVTGLTDFNMPTNELLLKAGLAATGSEAAERHQTEPEQQARQLEALQSLQVRSLMVCMLLVALLTIF